MPSRDVKVAVVPVTMPFPCKSLARAIEVEDRAETKDIRVIDRMAMVITVYLLAPNIAGDHGAAVSHVFATILLVILATSSGHPDL